MKLPYIIDDLPNVIFKSVKSTPPNTIPSNGVMISFTKELTILPNAAPITTPTAKSITFPLKANFLNSFHMC
ncbi:Uncharacterised protein [Streptococcus pneumoniae]|nr:Uncharacterised protein [Streptococcus pneumoniae]COH70343.1 Uncharacterised protein [Streptococcus pneumoniae]